MNTFNKPRIIGLAGTFASGKDTLAHYLVKEYNYLHVSTGDMVRQEALKTRGSIERPVLHQVANDLRHQHGTGVMVDLAIKTFEAKQEGHDNYNGVVISGLRSLGEAEAIKAAGGVLVFTDAPVETRYRRMVSRQRDDETKLSFDEFKAQEATELVAVNSDEDFNILGIKEIADLLLVNDADLEAYLHQAVQELGFS